MKTITIRDAFPDDRITRIAGERLRNMILDATAGGEKLEIDFGNAVIASTSFFDEGFAKLTQQGWTEEILSSRIVLKNIHRNDERVLWGMFRNRLKG